MHLTSRGSESRLATSCLCGALSPTLVPVITCLLPPSVPLGLLPQLLLLLMCDCSYNASASPFPVAPLTDVTLHLLNLLGTLMGIVTLLGHQKNSMKILLKSGRIIHLIWIPQLGSDQMGIWSEFEDHSLACKPYPCMKPKGRDFAMGLHKTKILPQVPFV